MQTFSTPVGDVTDDEIVAFATSALGHCPETPHAAVFASHRVKKQIASRIQLEDYALPTAINKIAPPDPALCFKLLISTPLQKQFVAQYREGYTSAKAEEFAAAGIAAPALRVKESPDTPTSMDQFVRQNASAEAQANYFGTAASGTSEEDGTPPAENHGDPLARFNAAINAAIASGGDRAAAIAAVVNGNPELHAAYLGAVNANHGRASAARTAAPPDRHPAAQHGMSAVDKWNGAVLAKERGGLGRGAAIAAVVKDNSDLHRAYLSAVNANGDRPAAAFPQQPQRPATLGARRDQPDGPAALAFVGAVEANEKLGMSRSAAVAAVVKNHPDLHDRYLEEFNRMKQPRWGR